MSELLKEYLDFIDRNKADLQLIAEADNDRFQFEIDYNGILDLVHVHHTHSGDWDYDLDDRKALVEYEGDFEKIIKEFVRKVWVINKVTIRLPAWLLY